MVNKQVSYQLNTLTYLSGMDQQQKQVLANNEYGAKSYHQKNKQKKIIKNQQQKIIKIHILKNQQQTHILKNQQQKIIKMHILSEKQLL